MKRTESINERYRGHSMLINTEYAQLIISGSTTKETLIRIAFKIDGQAALCDVEIAKIDPMKAAYVFIDANIEKSCPAPGCDRKLTPLSYSEPAASEDIDGSSGLEPDSETSSTYRLMGCPMHGDPVIYHFNKPLQ
jgi:hypothetical protein